VRSFWFLSHRERLGEGIEQALQRIRGRSHDFISSPHVTSPGDCRFSPESFETPPKAAAPRDERSSSSKATRNSSRVFITIGPRQAIGSPIGLPEMRRKRTASVSADTDTVGTGRGDVVPGLPDCGSRVREVGTGGATARSLQVFVLFASFVLKSLRTSFSQSRALSISRFTVPGSGPAGPLAPLRIRQRSAISRYARRP
jgi:hypothetical protein